MCWIHAKQLPQSRAWATPGRHHRRGTRTGRPPSSTTVVRQLQRQPLLRPMARSSRSTPSRSRTGMPFRSTQGRLPATARNLRCCRFCILLPEQWWHSSRSVTQPSVPSAGVIIEKMAAEIALARVRDACCTLILPALSESIRRAGAGADFDGVGRPAPTGPWSPWVVRVVREGPWQ